MVEEITVIPSGAGSVSLTMTGHGSSDIGWYSDYKAEVLTINVGYVFSHFEARIHHKYQLESFDGIIEHGSPWEGGRWYKNALSEFVYDYDDGRHYEHFVYELRAVFVPDVRELKTFSAHQHAGTTSGDGTYQVGQYANITAIEKCSPWQFDHWKISPYRDSKILTVYEQNYFLHILPEYGNIIYCTAFFRHANTGQLICDSQSGLIICGSDGNPLYNGNKIEY